MLTLTDHVREMVKLGMSNAEIIAALPRHNTKSIHVTAAKERQKLGVVREYLHRGPALQIPRKLHKVLAQQAISRLGANATANDIALNILTIVVDDDLFNAILGE